ELAKKSRPWSDEERLALREKHPSYPALLAARSEVEQRRRLQAALAAGKPLAEPTADEARAILAALPDSPEKLEEFAWPLIGPHRTVFGEEGTGLVLARGAVELASARPAAERAPLCMTLAWALVAHGNLDDAVQEGQRALEEASEGRRAELERGLAELEATIQLLLDPTGIEEEEKHLSELDARIATLEAEVSQAPP